MRFRIHILAMLVVPILMVSPAKAAQQPSYETLWAEATKQPDAKIVEYPDFTMVVSADGLTYYYFTKPSHFAHPGVIKRYAVQDNGNWVMREDGWSFGDDSAQPAFQRWLDQFKELDRQMAEQMRQQKGSAPSN
jgi:hypothetical protein